MPALPKQREAVEESFRGPRDNIDVGLQLSCIVDEFRQTIVADVKAKVICRYILEVMCFVKYDRTVVRQYCGNIRLANRKIGKKEMVIHNNDVGFHGFLPHECEEAS